MSRHAPLSAALNSETPPLLSHRDSVGSQEDLRALEFAEGPVSSGRSVRELHGYLPCLLTFRTVANVLALSRLDMTFNMTLYLSLPVSPILISWLLQTTERRTLVL